MYLQFYINENGDKVYTTKEFMAKHFKHFVANQVRGRKGESKGSNPVPGTHSDPPLAVPVSLPDKKTLELILDKLQKEDTYGVYAKPIDPEKEALIS